jgi:hypothetical protein
MHAQWGHIKPCHFSQSLYIYNLHNVGFRFVVKHIYITYICVSEKCKKGFVWTGKGCKKKLKPPGTCKTGSKKVGKRCINQSEFIYWVFKDVWGIKNFRFSHWNYAHIWWDESSRRNRLFITLAGKGHKKHFYLEIPTYLSRDPEIKKSGSRYIKNWWPFPATVPH